MATSGVVKYSYNKPSTAKSKKEDEEKDMSIERNSVVDKCKKSLGIADSPKGDKGSKQKLLVSNNNSLWYSILGFVGIDSTRWGLSTHITIWYGYI